MRDGCRRKREEKKLHFVRKKGIVGYGQKKQKDFALELNQLKAEFLLGEKQHVDEKDSQKEFSFSKNSGRRRRKKGPARHHEPTCRSSNQLGPFLGGGKRKNSAKGRKKPFPCRVMSKTKS